MYYLKLNKRNNIFILNFLKIIEKKNNISQI